jgi:beta-galactosidase
MKKRLLAMVCGCLFCGGIFAQHTWFNDKDLTLTGAYYYPEHWEESQWERDLKQMHELGFEFTHFAEFAWAQLEPQEGVYDFSWLDRAVALAAKYDLKVVMCTSTATPPVWLSRKYPEILLKSEDGTVQDHGARQHASFASPVYRKPSSPSTSKTHAISAPVRRSIS